MEKISTRYEIFSDSSAQLYIKANNILFKIFRKRLTYITLSGQYSKCTVIFFQQIKPFQAFSQCKIARQNNIAPKRTRFFNCRSNMSLFYTQMKTEIAMCRDCILFCLRLNPEQMCPYNVPCLLLYKIKIDNRGCPFHKGQRKRLHKFSQTCSLLIRNEHISN